MSHDEQASEWARYHFRLEEMNFAGELWFVLSLFALVGAGAALGYAELDWQSHRDSSIGIGTSGYALVQYARAAALGVISVALAAIGVSKKRAREFDVRYRDLTPPLPQGIEPEATSAGATGSPARTAGLLGYDMGGIIPGPSDQNRCAQRTANRVFFGSVICGSKRIPAKMDRRRVRRLL